MEATHISYCRNCAANCGLILNVEDNVIRSMQSDRANPISEGYVCIKGTMAVDLHNGGENRLTQCMKRGEDGRYHPIDKYQAVDEIADKLKSILEKHGPRSLAAFFGTPSYSDCVGKPFIKSLMATIGAPALFSSMTVDQSAKWVTAGRMGYWVNGKPFYTQTDVMLLTGNNPLISHQGYPISPLPCGNITAALLDVKQRGIKLIVIDPRLTETAKRADLFIQPLPGFDADILAAIIRLVLRAGHHKKAFCERWLVNLDTLTAAVEPFTPERVASRAQIPVGQIEEAARLLGSAKKAGLGTGTGNNMAAFSNTAEHLAEALTAILGAYVLAGDEIPNPGIFIPRPEMEMALPPNRTWEHEPKCLSADFGKIMGEFPASLFPDEVLAAGPERIRAVFCTGANPAMCLSEPDRVHEALDALDLLVTFDPRLNSATSQHAHYVIAPTLQFERAEVTTFSEGCFPVPFIQYAGAALEPPAGTIGEQEFFWRLARRLGLPITFKHIPFGGSFDDVPLGLSVDMETMPSRESLIRWLVEQTPVSFETLEAHPHGYRMDVRKTLRKAEHDNGARLDLCPPDVRDEIHAVEAREPEQEPGGYLLTVRRFVESFNSAFQGHKATQKRREVNKLHINPADCIAAGVDNNDAVEIMSQHGAIIGYVQHDPSMRRGVVSMCHCWGSGSEPDPYALRGSHTGRLVSMTSDLQSINRMPLQSGIRVTMRPLGFNLAEARIRSASAPHEARLN